LLHPPRYDLPDISEQGLEIGRQGIAGTVKVPQQLIEIVAQSRQSPIYEPIEIRFRLSPESRLAVFVEKYGTPKMSGPHSQYLSSTFDAFPFAHGETQVKLLHAWFCCLGPTHVLFSLMAERMRPGVWGPSTGPQRDGFALGKPTSRYPLPQFNLSSSIHHRNQL
jgi:hypothetical protein